MENFRKQRVSAAVGALIAFGVGAPSVAHSSLFSAPTAADSSFAPVPNRQSYSKDESYVPGSRQNGNSAFMGKGVTRTGAANLVNLRNDVNNSISSNISNVVTTIDSSMNTFKNSVSNQVNEVYNNITQVVDSAVAAATGGQSFSNEYRTYTGSETFVATAPYTGTAVLTIVGAGAGGNAGYQGTAGTAGNPGQYIKELKVPVTQGNLIYAYVGRGGSGSGDINVNSSPGQPSYVKIGGNTYSAAGGTIQSPRTTGCPVGATGIAYFTANPGDAGTGCSGGWGQPAKTTSGDVFPLSVGATGGTAAWGSIYYKQGTMAILSGQNNAAYGGGGAGGGPSRLYVGSRGFWQDPINGDGGPGNYFVPGSKGGDGYVKIRVYDQNEILTLGKLEEYVEKGGTADFNMNTQRMFASMPNGGVVSMSVPSGGGIHGNCGFINGSYGWMEGSGWCSSASGASSITIKPTNGENLEVFHARIGKVATITASDVALGKTLPVVVRYDSNPFLYQGGCGGGSVNVRAWSLKFSAIKEGAVITSYSATPVDSVVGQYLYQQCSSDGGE